MSKTSVETRANAWIIGRNSGLSSQAIWAHMKGISNPDRRWSYPHDPADFGRCARLLALIPEWRRRLRGMARYSKQWAVLVQRWSEIEACMESEVGIDWSKGRAAPKTYDLMRQILDRRKAA